MNKADFLMSSSAQKINDCSKKYSDHLRPLLRALIESYFNGLKEKFYIFGRYILKDANQDNWNNFINMLEGALKHVSNISVELLKTFYEDFILNSQNKYQNKQRDDFENKSSEVTFPNDQIQQQSFYFSQASNMQQMEVYSQIYKNIQTLQFVRKLNSVDLNKARVIQIKCKDSIQSNWSRSQIYRQRLYKYCKDVKIQIEKKLNETQLLKQSDKGYLYQSIKQIDQQVKYVNNRLTFIKKLQKQLRQKFHFSLHSYYCPPLQFILQNKLTGLKIIRIEQGIQKMPRSYFTKEYYYSIQTFDLLQIIDLNRNLKQLSVKGVQIKSLQETMNAFRMIKSNLVSNQKDKNMEKYKWMKNFKPQCKILLSLCAQISFYFSQRQVEIQNKIEDFEFFKNYFESISDMTIFIKDSIKNHCYRYKNIFTNLKRLRLKINCHKIYGQSLNSVIKWLPTFNQVSQIVFQRFDFRTKKQYPQLNLQILFAGLKIFFAKNKIDYLGIYNCQYFPAIPLIKTLRSVQLWDSPMPVGQLIKNNPQLNVVQINGDFQPNLNENKQISKILGNVQILTARIRKNENNFLHSISQQSFKNIKQLTLQNSCSPYKPITQEILKSIFPLMLQLTHLQLQEIDCPGKTIATISSRQLCEIRLFKNNLLTNKCLQLLEQKWPLLASIQIHKCNDINGKAFEKCLFLSITQLHIDQTILSKHNSIIDNLKKRGIQVVYPK